MGVLAGGGDDDSAGDSGEEHQQLWRQGVPCRRKGGGRLPLSPPLLTWRLFDWPEASTGRGTMSFEQQPQDQGSQTQVQTGVRQVMSASDSPQPVRCETAKRAGV